MVVISVCEPHHHGDVHVHEEGALPGREIAHDSIIGRFEPRAKFTRKESTDIVVVGGRAAFPLLAQWESEDAPSLRRLDEPLCDLAAPLKPYPAVATLEEAAIDHLARQHPLHQNHSFDVRPVHSEPVVES